MNSAIVWRNANIGHRDSRALQNFECTDHTPRMGLVNGIAELIQPAPWENAAQEIVQKHRIKGPSSSTWIERLGYDGEALATVALIRSVDGRRRFGGTVAVAKDFRGTGAADGMVDDVLRVIRALAHRDGAMVGAEIHRRNLPSQRLHERSGFSFAGNDPEAPEIQLWRMDIPARSRE